ncbi:hypothetical protein B9Z65_4427 [Elsinoe australis]|uniref:4-nitrophenylphosphatase n=1 Tax=Elsinoe australis TaxID=40998 RepID=A0A2P7Z2T3_9PEZI|nr:hypothetical protein B9Z65_4427 [Elsinoe australis]
MSRYETFLIDLDGVILSGEQVIPGSKEALEKLRSQGSRIIYVTNNSTTSSSDRFARLTAAGIATHDDTLYTSGSCTAAYLLKAQMESKQRSPVFLIGSQGLEAELTKQGIASLGGTDPALERDITSEDLKLIADGSALHPDVSAVVVGMDIRINYLKLALASQYLARGALFLATNTDASFEAYGATFPAAGVIAGALFPYTKRRPQLVGKPDVAMLEVIEQDLKIDRKTTCMIGDSLDTDMAFAKNGGLGGSILVLSGVTKVDDLPNQEGLPDIIIPSIAALSGID